MIETNIEKMQNLMNDPEFIAQLTSAKTTADGVLLFKEKGIHVTAAEIEAGYKKGMDYLENNGYIQNGELSMDALEMVSGGSRFGYGVAKLGAGAAGAGLGLLVGGVCLTPAAGLFIVGTIVAIGCCNL